MKFKVGDKIKLSRSIEQRYGKKDIETYFKNNNISYDSIAVITRIGRSIDILFENKHGNSFPVEDLVLVGTALQGHLLTKIFRDEFKPKIPQKRKKKDGAIKKPSVRSIDGKEWVTYWHTF